MITDANLRVSEDQAVTTTAVSTNTIDLLTATDIGQGKQLFMNFAVTTAMAGGTSVTFEVVTDDNASLSSPKVIGSSGAIATADLGEGANVVVAMNPQVGSNGERYLGARYTVAGTYTGGAITADVVDGIQDGQKFYASGFSV